jgi:glycerol-3-phosphate dehydrogenase (NAD+)
MGKEKIAIIGSGNWGSAIAKIAGQNASRQTDLFEADRIPMWVFEEEVNGRKLTEIINETHINEKYLPGIKLPENVYATADLEEVVKDATVFIFVLPHQFLGKTIEQLKGKVAKGARGITLIKGVAVEGDKIQIFADTIEKELGISCSALSGANIANEGKPQSDVERLFHSTSHVLDSRC